ncbi:MAG: 2-C-methyl-D-erythritol 4-phosphate cytidylyltransferase [Gammaproteobacteria bacterium]|nr:2-C-methyl-D-erythritol 4-phosphate cytidylyltransferase [Gammaproteobacteria bacterium]
MPARKKSAGEKIWAVAAAAGIGKRMMSPRPKQYLQLCGRRVIDRALLALCASDSVDGVIVGIRDDDEEWRARPFTHEKLIGISGGGDTRARTVLNALRQLLRGDAAAGDWALVHDAARPCLAQADIERLAAAARADGNGAVLALKVSDALKRGRDGRIEESLGGAAYWRALTPQMFRCGQLETALRRALERGLAPPDESSAMELAGARPLVVEGDPGNIKITVPADLEWAARYLEHREAAAKT